jgi:murein biosynthesis integral membrane protein MurJ
VAGGSFAIVLLIFAPLITSVIGPGLPADGHDKAVTLLRLAAPLVLFAPAGTLLGVYLNSQRVFTPVALRNAVAPGLVVLAFGLAWNRADVVNWVAAAYVVGFAMFFLTLFRAAVRSGHRQQWNVWPDRSELNLLWHAGSLPTLGFGVRQSVRLVERALASLGPPGGVAAYYFAFRVFSASQTVIGTSLATTSLPRMAEADLAGNRQRLGGLIRRSLKRSVMLSLPIALLFMLFHTEIVSLIYARGAFHGDSVTTSAKFFLLFGIALPFSCAVPVLQSGLYAQRAYGSVLKNMTFTGVLNIAMAVLLNHWFGLPGVAVAVSLSATSAVLNLLRLLRKSGVRVLGSDQPVS